MTSSHKLTAETLVALALAQEGFREQPPKSNRGLHIDLYTGNRPEPWCAHFVAWLFRYLGCPLPRDVPPNEKTANPLASVAFLEGVFKKQGWHQGQPAVGAVVFYSNRGLSDPGPGRHCGIVVSYTSTSITTIEGNWGDRVARRTLPRTDKRITGFGVYPFSDPAVS